ncbi:hypothetical protein [Niallia taxi]|uniref:hypothetical protein n=1 Tax=Niallia taxi TaxID=2499688 RepID=UPI0015F505ED|nr:hypothetical protein [Niallia taxi]
MKKIRIWFYVIFVFLMINQTVHAAEEPARQYFGVGAKVEQVENGIYRVTTEGKQPNEGVVFSLKATQIGLKPTISLDLRGQGNVALKIQETDAKGQFIRETMTHNTELSGEWQQLKLTTELSNELNLIDVTVLTTYQHKASFQFKGVKVNK